MRHKNWPVLGLLFAASLLGCGSPPISDVASEGGSSPDPTGLLLGSVQYVGPRPLCEYQNGKPTKILGVGAVLILYGFKDPGPPDGPLPASVLVVPMSDFFKSFADCMPENPTPADLHKSVSSSAPYAWPRIPLGQGLAKRSYRVEAIFDRDGDYYPLLPLTNGIHTAGDAIGGATIGFGRDYREIVFNGLCEEEIGNTGRDNGQVVAGVGVTIALPLWTERQMFEVKQTNANRYLSSEQFIDVGESDFGPLIPPPAFSPDPEESRKEAYLRLREFAGLELNLIDKDRADPKCEDPEKLAEDGSNKCVGSRLERLGISYDLQDQKSYAWHLWPNDTDGDGYAEDHPLSFAFGPPAESVESDAARGFAYSTRTPWTLPLIFLSRIQSEEEKLARIPAAGLLGGVDKYAQQEHSVWYPKLPVSVIPTVSVSTAELDADNDGRNDCDVDVYAPGNFDVTWEVPGRYSDCQELPVGDYSIVTITGVAGNVVYKKDARSQTGWNLALPDEDEDGEADPFAVAGVGQIWLHPNDLGDASKFVDGFEPEKDAEAAAEQAQRFALESQSQAQAFKIRDPNPEGDPRPFIPDDEQLFMNMDGTQGGKGDCDVGIVPGATVTLDKIEFPEIPAACCAPETVALCDVPRCKASSDDEGNLEATRLRAWVSKNKKVQATDFDSGDQIMSELEEQAVTLAEAAEITNGGGTVIFRGSFEEVLPTEEADLVIPRDGYNPKERQYITYDEYAAEDDSIAKVAYPDCEELRANRDKPAEDSSPDEKSPVRLKIKQLEPSCIPFLIPAGCCK